MSGSTPDVNGDTSPGVQRRRDRAGDFRVVLRKDKNGEYVFTLLGQTGVALYTFSDLHDATAEAAELNTQDLQFAATP
jgi:hypothetical protein